VVFHSLTNPIEEVGLRLLSSVSGVDSYRMRTGQLDDIEWTELSAGLAKLNNAPLAIEANHRGDFESCVEHTRQHAKHFDRPPGLIVIDDFQAFTFLGKQCALGEARQDALNRLRKLAVELAAPLMILSQLDARIDRRPDPNPCLSDLPRSGNIEAAADTILLLKRDYDNEFGELQPDEPSRPCRIEIHQAKSRFDYLGRCRISLPKGAMSISLCWGATNAP
jgi:replicative DNA helicase